jgi:YegS/Rv2252/BmrU family lipid kinase
MEQQDPNRRKRVLVIVNPTAGRRRRSRLASVLSALLARGCETSVHTTSARGDAEELTRNLRREQVDVLAIAGGDGTINEVLNGLDAASPPVAVIPLGTANVLAAEIGLGSEPEAVADTIAFGHPRRISLGLVNERRFAVMASLGLDAEVVRYVSLRLKRYLGKGAYAYETLNQLMSFAPAPYDLSIDGEHRQAYGLIVANGRFFAGQFVVAPDARLDKPTFDVCCCTSGGRLATLRYLAAMVRGRLPERADYRIIQATSVRISGPDGAAVQADGDLVARLPATISIQPDAVALMVPRLNDPARDRQNHASQRAASVIGTA